MTNATLIGSAEAARILSVERTTFNKWAAKGLIKPTVKLPGRTGVQLFTIAEIRRFKNARA